MNSTNSIQYSLAQTSNPNLRKDNDHDKDYYSNNIPKSSSNIPQKKHSWSWLHILCCILCILLISGSIYYYINKESPI